MTARDDAAGLRERIEALADELWRESQANDCRIREAGVMQAHVNDLRALLAESTPAPAPAADGGEVEAWYETDGDATYPDVLHPDVPVPVDWWWTPEGRAEHDADIRRTARAEAAEEIAVWVRGVLTAPVLDREWLADRLDDFARATGGPQ